MNSIELQHNFLNGTELGINYSKQKLQLLVNGKNSENLGTGGKGVSVAHLYNSRRLTNTLSLIYYHYHIGLIGNILVK